MEIVLLTVVVFLVFGGMVFLIIRSLKGQPEERLKNLEKDKDALAQEKARIDAELQSKVKETGSLSEQLQKETSSKDELAGQVKQLDKENFELKNNIRRLEQDRDELQKKVTGYEREEKQNKDKLSSEIKGLDNAKQSFEDEKQRIRGEDEERLKKITEERNRMWSEHQITVVAKLKEICQRPEIGFNFYDDKSLPKSFDGSLKPDFLVEIFAEQYLIFDAKSSENKISTYFTAQVPSTVQKIKKSASKDSVYPTIFFVVPNDLMQTARKNFAFQDGYSFFMISPESLAPILWCYKRITQYEFAEQLDPQDRENIVNVLSGYESFIRNQNAMNLLVVRKAVEVIKSKETLSDEIMSQIDLKLKNIKPFTLKVSDMKKLTQSTEELEKQIQDLTAPKADIERKDLEEVKKALA